jgi:hypothetical protein
MEDANQMQNVPQPEAESTEKQTPVTPTETIVEAQSAAQQCTEQPIEKETTTEQAPAENAAIDSSAAKEVQPTNEAKETPKEPVFQEPEVDYSGKSREELTEALKALLQEDVMHIRNRANKIKDLFTDLNHEVLKADYEAFLADGGDKTNYEQHNDDVAGAFFKLFDEYREQRQKHIDEQEAIKQANLEKKNEIIAALRQLAESQDQITIKEMHNRFNELQAQWKQIGEVPRADANSLWQSYHLWADQLFAKIKLERESMMEDMKRNLENKIQLCEQAEAQIMNENDMQAFHKLQELRVQWKQTGPVPPEQNDTIWNRFQDAAERISSRHKEVIANRQESQQKNLLAKQALVDKVNELTAAARPTTGKEWKVLTDQMNELLKVWKTIGPVPKEQSETIWNAFIEKRDIVYKDKKAFFDQLRSSQDANYKKKVELCEQAEAIAEREDLKEATPELLQLQAEWKETGSVRHEVSEQLWKRFRAACDKFFSRKSERYEEVHADEKDNLVKKEAVLTELKQMTFGENKDENLSRLKDIQRRWVEIGFVPRSDKDRLQKDFRETINTIFNQLKLTAREAEETAFKERIQRHAGDMHFARNERSVLQEKIEHLRNDIKTLENNLGFLSNSKQADLLKEEFDRKIQNTRQQLALLEAKLKILDSTPKEQPAAKGQKDIKSTTPEPEDNDKPADSADNPEH